MSVTKKLIAIAIALFVLIVALPSFLYEECRIDVPNMHMAVLTHKTGMDLERGAVIAPSDDYKGVKKDVLTEGRYYYNPYEWTWQVVPQVDIPRDKVGVRIRLYGDNLPAGELIAKKDNQKGILNDVLQPGRYALNACIVKPGSRDAIRNNCAELIELHDPVTIDAGYKGLMTDLTADMPSQPNELVSAKGERGVQATPLEPGTYLLNPYVKDVRKINCRSQRYNLTDIGFPTKDGFWVSIQAVIEFRVKPEDAAKTYILFNEEREGKTLPEQLIAKVILPNARAYTRLQGSNFSGKEFIAGDTRVAFQANFQETMKANCDKQGIEIIQALIKEVNPPDKIADPVRRREIAVQQENQYRKEIEQQKAETTLAVEKATVQQRKEKVVADQEVVVVTTEAQKKQKVALIEADKRLAVAEQKLQAAQDLAAAIMAKGKADANVVNFANEAEAAGWQKSVAAFSGNGGEFARWTLLKKLAPAFRSMMINTDSSPLMDVFKTFDSKPTPATPPANGSAPPTNQ
jgi:regulator of protease activity HflC (stomatin/prohibitin superfamily)